MSDKSQAIWTWIARVVILLGMIAAALAGMKQLPQAVQQYAAGGVSVLGIAAAWIYSFLPPKATKAPKS